MKPSDSELAWAAGYFEGEGYVGVKVNPPRLRSVSPEFRLYVVITNTDREPLEKLVELFGGSTYVHSKDPRVITQKRGFQWWVGARVALNFLEQVLPYMQSPNKVMQVKLAIEFQKSVMSHSNDAKLSDEAIMRRMSIVDKLKALKHGGTA